MENYLPESPTVGWSQVSELEYDRERQVFVPSFTLSRTPERGAEDNMEATDFNTEYEENATGGPTDYSRVLLDFESNLETPEQTRRLINEVEQYIDTRERTRATEESRDKRARNDSDGSHDEQEDRRSKQSRRETGGRRSNATDDASEEPEEPTTEQLMEVFKLIKGKITDAATRRSSSKIQFTLTEQKIVMDSLVTLEEVWAHMCYKAGRNDAIMLINRQRTGTTFEENKELVNLVKDLRNEVRDVKIQLNEGKGTAAEVVSLRKEITDLRKEMTRERSRSEKSRGEKPAAAQEQTKPPSIAEILREEKKKRADKVRASEAENLRNRSTPDRRSDNVREQAQTQNTDEGTQDERVDREANRQEGEWTLVQNAKRTYAKIAGGTREANTGANWRTPEKNDALESVVTVVGVQEQVKALQAVKAALTTTLKETGNMRGVQPINGGRVILRYKDENQKSMAVNELGNKGGAFIIGGSKTQKPTFTVTGVWRGYLDEEIKQMIIAENEDFDKEFGEAFLREAKVVVRKKCRNDKRENVTLEAPANIVKHMIRKGTINLDMRPAHINEAVTVTICFNCHRFGHVMKFCTFGQTCQHCGGSHDGLQCEAEERDCVNCRAYRLPAELRRHSARDKDCPMYIRRENANRRRIQYDQ